MTRMFIPDKFLIKDLFKSFRRCKIGFYIDDIKPYNKALASIRMRCYDIIDYFEKKGIHAELYKPLKKYDLVIFTKTCTNRSVEVAKKLKEKGTGVYFESYCEYLDNEKVDNQEKRNILATMGIADIVGVSSDVQQETFSKFHNHVLMIPESVHDDFFRVQKKHEQKEKLTLVYCGYSHKAKDTLCILDVLKRLQKEKNCDILYLCEKDPELTELSYRYLKYDQKRIAEQFMEGDIMIAPRPMSETGMNAHSFTKAAYPLAAGLPTVASPMPSYKDSPVILCDTEEEWYAVLTELMEDVSKRQQLGNEGREFVREHYSVEAIGSRYYAIWQELKG